MNLSLVTVELPESVYWPLKILFCVAAAYVFYQIMADINDGFVIRRGVVYSLESEPRSYFRGISLVWHIRNPQKGDTQQWQLTKNFVARRRAGTTW